MQSKSNVWSMVNSQRNRRKERVSDAVFFVVLSLRSNNCLRLTAFVILCTAVLCLQEERERAGYHSRDWAGQQVEDLLMGERACARAALESRYCIIALLHVRSIFLKPRKRSGGAPKVQVVYY